MVFMTKMFVRAQNWQKGQTMTEYALILAAVAVVVYAGYKTMGTSISGLLTSVDGNLRNRIAIRSKKMPDGGGAENPSPSARFTVAFPTPRCPAALKLLPLFRQLKMDDNRHIDENLGRAWLGSSPW